VILKLHGHIGSTASALVDGQLTPEEEERAWAHVLTCAGCRRLVEREGSVKQRLAGLADPVDPGAVPSRLAATLADLESTAAAWVEVDEIERRSNRRRATAVLVGAGSVSVAAAALLGLTGSTVDPPGSPVEPSPASIRSDVVDSAVDGALRPVLAPGSTPSARATSPSPGPVTAMLLVPRPTPSTPAAAGLAAR
jgi:anti-sigma factor RsiW